MISRDPLANRGADRRRARGHARAAAAGADGFDGVELRPIEGDGPQRDVYALLPPGGRHPLAERRVRARWSK